MKRPNSAARPSSRRGASACAADQRPQTPGGRGLSAQDRAKALKRAEQEIEKSFGKGALQRMSGTEIRTVPTVPTGTPSLDLALGVGGYPYGRLVEVFGPESSGKTTLALHAVAQCQLQGGVCAFVDAEHALDIAYAGKLGVNVDDLLVSQPDHGEQALQIVEMLVRSAAVDLVVIDSVAALVPRAELEGSIGDVHVGLQARLMSQALRKLAGVVSQAGALVLFINQTRQKIGVTFGPSTTTSGGKALRFYTSMRLEVRRIGSVKSGEQMVGNRTLVKVAKNKMAPPFRRAEFDIIYGAGFDWAADLVDLGVAAGLVDKSGAWFSMGGERLGQGRARAAESLMASPGRAIELQRQLYGAAGLTPPVLPLPDAAGVATPDVGAEAELATDDPSADSDSAATATATATAKQLGFGPMQSAPKPTRKRRNGAAAKPATPA